MFKTVSLHAFQNCFRFVQPLECTAFSRPFHCVSYPLLFRTTPFLRAEPLKKKKRIDPAVIKMREERKKRKIEKQIKKLEKVGNKLKPIDELEVPPRLLKEQILRTRASSTLSPEEEDYRAILFKEWARYKTQQHLKEVQMFDRLAAAQMKALNELKMISDELYLEAIQPDACLFPYKAVGPSCTPPVENYDYPDGEYLDITKKWD